MLSRKAEALLVTTKMKDKVRINLFPQLSTGAPLRPCRYSASCCIVLTGIAPGSAWPANTGVWNIIQFQAIQQVGPHDAFILFFVSDIVL